MQHNIILVDDDDADRYLCVRKVARSNKKIRIWEFASGDEFSNELKETSSQIAGVFDEKFPPLLLLDINMPGMSGFDVVDALREEIQMKRLTEKSMAVFICSSSSHPQDLHTAQNDDLIRGFIVKPASVRMIEDLVDQNCAA